MKLTREFMLGRIQARDADYDGKFITGVLSTGIYCRPSCKARHPRPENVQFFETVAAAKSAGLRPCLRCHPDEFMSGNDPDEALVVELTRRVRADLSAFPDVVSLEAAAGVGATHLNALFRRHFHTTPGGFLHRERCAAARRLLLETDRRVVDVALDAGYESLSAFHDGFRRCAGMSPGDYRRLRTESAFAIGLPKDYPIDAVQRYIGRDPESPTERVKNGTTARAIALEHGAGILHVEMRNGSARCRVESAVAFGPRDAAAAHATALRILGLGIDPYPFVRRLRGDRSLFRLVRGRTGLRIPQTESVFEGLTWSIIGQQVNLRFAFSLRRSLVEMCGRHLAGGFIAHPAAEAVARLDHADLTRRQFSRRKAEYLIDAARRVASGELPIETFPALPAAAVERSLLRIRGFGPWSAQYVMMRSCGFADCVPVGDAGLAAALKSFFQLEHRPNGDETRVLMRPFAPYRSLATFHLWASLGGGG
jgi:AraC family transcriptional regulator of adaptative response / DNA-3-methyladenine glycosylase II